MLFSGDRQILAEAFGTLVLTLAVIGSGIMATRLSGGNDGVALLAVTGVTVSALVFLISLCGPISGAHFNPAVTVALALRRIIAWRTVPGFVLAQLAGGALGAIIAHLLFSEPFTSVSMVDRSGWAMWTSEVAATFGLLLVIIAGIRFYPSRIGVHVAAYIGAGFWFTPSTCFSNPALTIARSLTGTFTGIRPEDAISFITAQFCGAILACLLVSWLFAASSRSGTVPAAGPAPDKAEESLVS
jgi:glycerol uptake facilitator-like aquaporin